MKTKPGEGMEMSASPIDRILAGEEELIPASGFAASVMERIEEEARVPADRFPVAARGSGYGAGRGRVWLGWIRDRGAGEGRRVRWCSPFRI